MHDGLPKYFTVDDVARILGVERDRVWAWRRAGLVREALKAGQIQFDRAGLARMAVLVALQDVFGLKSEVPAQILREHAPVIDCLLDDLTRDRALVITTEGQFATATLRVPLAFQLRDALAATPL